MTHLIGYIATANIDINHFFEERVGETVYFIGSQFVPGEYIPSFRIDPQTKRLRRDF
ncbi:2330_t:CDS:2 [Acaulospora morrowiae]|uniref:2330_t:CDS:1 n=1 Tax=Acaulospora morrowiae TaxID=94023 RepID=A0A9N8W4J9_9GLOM|nr:2330_t:CDS:2 [Acaulospora morrowiae]